MLSEYESRVRLFYWPQTRLARPFCGPSYIAGHE